MQADQPTQPPSSEESAAAQAGSGPTAPEPGPGRPEAVPLPDLAEQLAQAQAQAAEHYDRYVRAAAEMDNVRRRAQEDVAKAHKYSIEAFAESLLPVRDSLEMALKVDTPTVTNLKEGVEATLRLLASVFEKNKLLEIDPAGQKFDPNRHQAISMVPVSATHPPVPRMVEPAALIRPG